MVDASGTNKYTYTIAERLFTEDLPSQGCGTASGP